MAERPRYRQIGQRIRQARQERGWSQRELAEQAEISQTAVHHYEQGSRRIGVADLERMARLLGRSLDFFLARDDAAAQEPPSVSERRMAEVLGLRYLPVVPTADLPAASGAQLVRDAAVRWLPLPRELTKGADAIVPVKGKSVRAAPGAVGLGALRPGDLLLVRFDPPGPDLGLPALLVREGELQVVPAARSGSAAVGLVVGVLRRFAPPPEE